MDAVIKVVTDSERTLFFVPPEFCIKGLRNKASIEMGLCNLRVPQAGKKVRDVLDRPRHGGDNRLD